MEKRKGVKERGKEGRREEGGEGGGGTKVPELDGQR